MLKPLLLQDGDQKGKRQGTKGKNKNRVPHVDLFLFVQTTHTQQTMHSLANVQNSIFHMSRSGHPFLPPSPLCPLPAATACIARASRAAAGAYDFKLPFFTANHPERVSILEQLPFYTWCYWSVVLNRRNTVVNTGCYHGVVLNRCNTVG